MNKQIAFSLKSNYSTDPFSVDRILISAFIYMNQLEFQHNKFLKSYVIRSGESREHSALTQFMAILKTNSIELNMEEMIELFEFVISPKDKVITGAVYTPECIREYIIENTIDIDNVRLMKVADISCGCGGFLFSAAKLIKKLSAASYYDIFRNQIFGLDIQTYSVTRTKLLLSLLAISEGEDREVFEFNIFSGNALNFDWQSKLDNFTGFDLIVGNPPYVCARNIPIESRELLSQWSVSKSGHPDLYIPFFQIGLTNLKDNGKLGYITMSTFFKSVNGRSLRQYFNQCRYDFNIIDFNALQVFKSKSTYTCICLITKKESQAIRYQVCTNLKCLNDLKNTITTQYDILDSHKGWSLNSRQHIIKQIENIGSPFHEKYKTRNGIATLKNNVYIFHPHHESRLYYYLQDGKLFVPIEKRACRTIINSNLLTKAKSLKNIKEKIIFPYEIVNGKAVVFSEENFKQQFPKAYSYLLTKKSVLATRDKGKGKKYSPWFMFGRNQSLEKLKHKLFFPHIASELPNYVLDSDDHMLFYNGLAVIGQTREELVVLKKLLSSKVFWFYIKNTSRPYGSNYFSLSRNYIKHFGVPNFTKEESDFIKKESDKNKLDAFFESKYCITLT